MEPIQLELDPQRVQDLKQRRAWSLEVIQIPALRLVGFLFLSVAVELNNRYLLGQAVPGLGLYAAGVLTWSLVSWVLLAVGFGRWPGLGNLFLALDLVAFTVAVALSGGERSWLFPVLILRPADLMSTGFRKVALFGALSTAAYATMLALTGGFTPEGLTKLLLIAFANFYLALTARPVDSLIARNRAAVRVARDAVRQLQEAMQERERMEQERIRAQKLESLSALAGGIAHDFNNLLTAILGSVSLLRIDPQRVPERLEDLELACLRARDLTRQLLTFAKGGAPIRKVFAAWPVVRETATFALRGSRTLARVEAPEDLWHLDADEAQVAQVVQNLVLNAAEAMPQGGTVHVRLCNVTPEAAREVDLDPTARWVLLSVEDEGGGIGEDLLSRIFDPYFTTKPTGSGLGLTTSHSIVVRHGGKVRVQSEPGRGTRFHVYLPAAEGRAPERPVLPVPSGAGRGRVLVMDDDPMVRRVASQMLVQLGYEPHAVPDGAAAVDLYRRDPEGWTAVIMDLTVPGGVGGVEAMRQLREVDPRARAIVSSGYSDDPVMSDPAPYGFRGVLAKPYRVQELSAALQALLAS